jgi:hypothetical protein
MDTFNLPYWDPIERIERLLRGVVHDVLEQQFGPLWPEDPAAGLGRKWVERLRDKERMDRCVQQGTIVAELPIAYAEFKELGQLLQRNRALFEPVFPDWETFWVYYRTADRLRNAVKHHRDLPPPQYDLLAGVAGEIEDAVSLWRIGVRLHVQRTIIQFHAAVPTTDRTPDQVLAAAAELTGEWRERFLGGTRAELLNPRARDVRESDGHLVLRVQQQQLEISGFGHSNPNQRDAGVDYHAFNVELTHRVGSTRSLSELIAYLGRPYRHVAYELPQEINLAALQRSAEERAGLSGGSVSVDGRLGSIDFSLLGGKLRVAAGNALDDKGKSTGRISATVDPPDGWWRAHEVMTVRELFGFMVGSISPRTMTHLVAAARRPYRSESSSLSTMD